MGTTERTLKAFSSKASGLKALVVDFDAASLHSLSSFLRELGLEVVTARDGQAGLEMFRQQKPQIVLLEAMLPKISGFELSKQIHVASQGQTPVIMVSGVYKDVRHKIEAMQTYGAAAFLTKPWKKEELASTILNLIQASPKSGSEEEEAIEETLQELGNLMLKQPAKPDEEKKLAKPSFLPKEEKNKEKAKISGQANEDVDKLLEKTLADLGFPAKKKVPSTEKKGPTGPAAATSAAATLEPEPVLKPKPILEPKPIAEPKPPKPPVEIKEEERKGIKETKTKEIVPSSTAEVKVAAEPVVAAETKAVKTPIPSSFRTPTTEEKNKRLPLLLGIAAAITLTLLGFLLIKPKKVSPPEKNAAQAELIQKATSEPTATLPSRLEEQEMLSKAARTKEETTPAKTAPENKPEVTETEETPPPVLPTNTPLLTLPIPEFLNETKTETPPANQTTEQQATTEAQGTPAMPAEKVSPVEIKEGDLIPLSEVDVPPKMVKTVEPKYPPLAMQMGLEGSVLVNALISEKGDVIRTEILRGIKNGASLEQAAQNAIKQWKFTPAIKNGVKVKVWKPIETRFQLKQ